MRYMGRLRASLMLAAMAGMFIAPVAAQQPSDRGLALLDAVQQSLRLNPSTLLQQQQVEANQGIYLQAQGQFDPVRSAAATRGRQFLSLRSDQINQLATTGIVDVRSQLTETTSYRLGLDKILMNGIGLGAGFAVTSIDDNLARLQNIPVQTAGTFSFRLNAPLLRNSGRETVGATVDATEAELSAARLDLNFTNAQTVLNTTLAYWDYVAKQRLLEIAVVTEKRLSDLVDETRKLIAADQVPAADIQLVLASQAEKIANRVLSEQALIDARRILARQIGLTAEYSMTLPLPRDDFPRYDGAPLEFMSRIDKLQEAALAARSDLEALKARVRADGYRLAASRNNLKPQLDFNLNLSYSGLAEGAQPSNIVAPYNTGRVGPSVTASLALLWPYENSAARGVYQSQSAAYEANIIRLRDLQASIGSLVAIVAIGLKNSAELSKVYDEAVRRYEITLQNERTKHRLGTSTLIDVINVEDRLRVALGNQVQVRQNYASAVVQFRFELGQLIRQSGEEFSVSLSDLLSGRFDVPN